MSASCVTGGRVACGAARAIQRTRLASTAWVSGPAAGLRRQRQQAHTHNRSRAASKVQSLFGWGSSAVEEEADYYDESMTVAKVQVGLLGSAREIQKDLERIAAQADTDSPEGLHYILQETVLALMRNPDYCLYAYSTGAAMADPDRAEQRFNEFSMEERSKFKAETLLNVGGLLKRGTRKRDAEEGGPQELIVVTIIVAAVGRFKLPKITSRGELRTALQRLGAVRADDILAVEVLWTPEEEDDYFTVTDLAMDYPLLNTL